MRNRDFRASVRAAAAGIGRAWRVGRNVRFQWAAAYAALLLGHWVGLPATEMALLILTSAAVIAAETVNTAVEQLVDLASASYHPLARAAKDMAAGAVLVTAVAALAVGALLLLPHLPSLPATAAARLSRPGGLLALLPLAALVWGWLAGRPRAAAARGEDGGAGKPAEE